MLEISNNSTSIFRSCPKKYYFRYIKGLEPYKKSPALTLGSILHSGFDMYYNGFSNEEVARFIGKTADEEIAKASPDTAEDLVIMKYTLLGMWLNYPKDLSIFSEIKPELKLKLTFSNGVVAVIKVDGLVTKDGKLWIRELKTTGLTFTQFSQRCRTSSQGTFYPFCLRRLGYPVEGIIYDYVKKPQLRKGMHEDKDQFGYRIMQSYREKPDYYFQRHFSYRTELDLLLFEKDIMATAKNIERCCRENEWYRNQDSCWTFNSACPYLPICFQDEPDELTIQVFFLQTEINPNKGGTDGGE
jgi:hypothetical protein